MAKMKRYDLKIPIRYGEGKTYWKTIGTLFAHPDTHLVGLDNKPASFVIDYPPASGIIAKVEEKESQSTETQDQPPI